MVDHYPDDEPQRDADPGDQVQASDQSLTPGAAIMSINGSIKKG
jgi:hypothetical protein